MMYPRRRSSGTLLLLFLYRQGGLGTGVFGTESSSGSSYLLTGMPYSDRYLLRACYAMSGTDAAYGATRLCLGALRR
eukprot:1802007-Rhodomonas_salina.3